MGFEFLIKQYLVTDRHITTARWFRWRGGRMLSLLSGTSIRFDFFRHSAVRCPATFVPSATCGQSNSASTFKSEIQAGCKTFTHQ